MDPNILFTFCHNPACESVVHLHNQFCTGKCKELTPSFWCCRPGREFARLDTEVYTDADCYVVSLLFKYLKVIHRLSYRKDTLDSVRTVSYLFTLVRIRNRSHPGENRVTISGRASYQSSDNY